MNGVRRKGGPDVKTPNRGRAALGALVVALLVATGGCAYFNLFYNAEQAFEEGERLGQEVDPREQPTNQQRTQYRRAIEKSKMLLEEYPDSDLVDDALFLIGKSHLRLQEWGDALQYLDNLLVNFPQSEFVQEAMYLKSLAHFGRGEEEVGLDWFARLREAFPEGRYGAEALFRLGQAYAEDDRHDQAIRYYEEYLERYPDGPDASSTRLALARSLVVQERHTEAVERLERIDPERISPVEFFEAQKLRIVGDLTSIAANEEQRDVAVLLEGRSLLAQDRADEGFAVLERLTGGALPDRASGEAWYTIIEYLVEQEGPTSETLAAKIEAATAGRGPGRDWAPRIQRRADQLARFEALRTVVADSDTTASVRSEAAFRLGELLLFDFERPGDALAWYEQSIEIDPETSFAPRAAYAIGYVQSEFLEDPDAADAAFARLQERYPDSPQARSLRGEQFLTAKERTQEELEALAEARLRGAGTGGTGGPGGTVDSDDPRLAPNRSLRFGGPGAFTPRERGGR